MINYNTILSSFDDRGTLMKWLQKVEEALQAAGLDNVTVNVVDSTHITLSFDFADGSSVTSDPIELPQGPQGEQGPPGADATQVIANPPVGSLAPALQSLAVSGIAYKIFDGDSTELTADGAGVGEVLQPDALGAVFWDKLDADNLSTFGATQGQVLTANGSNGVGWTDVNYGAASCNLVNSSYATVGTAECRWLKVGSTANVTIDIQTGINATVYAVELPAAIQGCNNSKQHGQFMGSTTGTAKYMLAEVDTAAADPGKYIHFVDAMMMNATLAAYTTGCVNITLKY